MTAATFGALDVAVASALTSCVVPSEKTAVTTIVCDAPTLSVPFAGDSSRRSRPAGIADTVTLADALNPLAVAVTRTVPGDWPTTVPALTEAVALAAETHVALLVTSWADPSLNTSVATKLLVAPTAIVVVGGDTRSSVGVGAAGVTTSVAEPVRPPAVAEMVVVPSLTPVATAAAIDATVRLEETQVAVAVTSNEEPSEPALVAVNACVDPTRMLAVDGSIWSTYVTGVRTVTLAVAWIP